MRVCLGHQTGKGFRTLVVLILVAIENIVGLELLKSLHVDLGLQLLESVGVDDHVKQYKTIYSKAAPLLVERKVGESLTVLLFDDVYTGHQASYIREIESDPIGSATLIQEHTFGPAHKMSELLIKKTVVNMNGRAISFVSDDGGKTIRANGRLVTQTDIDLGNNIVGHRIEGILVPVKAEKYTVEVVPSLLGGLLGKIGTLLGFVKLVLEGILGDVLGKLALAKEIPMTFISPGVKEMEVLKTTYLLHGPAFAKPAFEKVIKENTYVGSYSPLELSNAKEMTNLAGEKKNVYKRPDGKVVIQDQVMDPYEVIPTKNGFAYGEDLLDVRSAQATNSVPLVTRSISENNAAVVDAAEESMSSSSSTGESSGDSLALRNLPASRPVDTVSDVASSLPLETLTSRNLPVVGGLNSALPIDSVGSALPLDKVSSTSGSNHDSELPLDNVGSVLPVDVPKILPGIL